MNAFVLSRLIKQQAELQVARGARRSLQHSEGWARDVSEDVAREVFHRAGILTRRAAALIRPAT
jgi:hypothetical protein